VKVLKGDLLIAGWPLEKLSQISPEGDMRQASGDRDAFNRRF
jgi:hypothetical protein